jgi:hypothetical protein
VISEVSENPLHRFHHYHHSSLARAYSAIHEGILLSWEEGRAMQWMIMAVPLLVVLLLFLNRRLTRRVQL